jgi:ubiquinone/menaquinone biosynthesis C-methylase UbiE
MSTPLCPTTSMAVQAFDALAPIFDARFGAWKSVAAQRSAVRAELLTSFTPGASLLELGGGTGEDALFLAERGYRVHLTDGSPAMISRAEEKVRSAGAEQRITLQRLAIEELSRLDNGTTFDGCFSNFAAFNCVENDSVPARALARVLAPGARALFVIFGPCCPGEMLTLLLRGEGSRAFRRLSRRGVAARVGGHSFVVSYPRPAAFARSFAPWFALRRTQGVGIFVPPSSAEPWISEHPRLLALMEQLDRVVSSPLALLGDHVLVTLERTEVPA